MKKKLIKILTKILEIDLKLYTSSIIDLQNSNKNETKSSAGDKYETSRSMNQMEMQMQITQLQKVEYNLLQISQIEKLKTVTKICFGSLVRTENSYYFISISYGKIIIENETIIVLSGNSPIAKLLLNKQVGDSFIFNNFMDKILSIS